MILVVDDEVVNREITKVSLETYNYRVLTASTIRTLQKVNPQVKIIAVSGIGANKQLAEATGSAVKAFLSKPCTTKDLLQTIHTVKSGVAKLLF